MRKTSATSIGNTALTCFVLCSAGWALIHETPATGVEIVAPAQAARTLTDEQFQKIRSAAKKKGGDHTVGPALVNAFGWPNNTLIRQVAYPVNIGEVVFWEPKNSHALGYVFGINAKEMTYYVHVDSTLEFLHGVSMRDDTTATSMDDVKARHALAKILGLWAQAIDQVAPADVDSRP